MNNIEIKNLLPYSQYILRDSLDILIDNLVDKERSLDAVLHTKETLSFKERVSIDFALNHLLGVLGGIDKDAVIQDELSLSNESPLAIGSYVRDRDHVMNFREVKGVQGLPEGDKSGE